jgi:hypothetical protein
METNLLQRKANLSGMTHQALWMAIALIVVVTIGLFLSSLESRFWTPSWESSGLSR